MGSESRGRGRTNRWTDAGLAALFVVTFILGEQVPREASDGGFVLHEWLGVLAGAIALAHFVLHWDWVVSTTRSLLLSRSRRRQINYVMALALAVSFVAVLITGLQISSLAGMEANLATGIRFHHHAASKICLLAVLVHLGLHWRWIVQSVKQLGPAGRKAEPVAEPGRAQPVERA